MAEGAFNFQELARQLGLKNVRELPLVRSLTPVVLAGDGRELVAPLLPASAFSGGIQSPVIAEFGSLQLRALGSGGLFVRGFNVGHTVISTVAWRIDRDGVDPFAADPIVGAFEAKHETGFGTTESTVRLGTTTAVLTGSPTIFSGFEATWFLDFFVPSAGIFTLQLQSANSTAYFAIQWREVPSPALSPTG